MTPMEEVEAAEAAVLPKFRCGVYRQRVVIDDPVVAGPISEGLMPLTVVPHHYEDIEPTPWWRFDE